MASTSNAAFLAAVFLWSADLATASCRACGLYENNMMEEIVRLLLCAESAVSAPRLETSPPCWFQHLLAPSGSPDWSWAGSQAGGVGL